MGSVVALHQDAAQRAADAAAMLAETQEAIVVVALASPVKALLALTTVVVLQPNAQRKLAVVVPLAVAAVVSVVIKATTLAIKITRAMAAVMTSSPAIFVTMLVATSLALAQTTKANATAPVVNLTHCAPA